MVVLQMFFELLLQGESGMWKAMEFQSKMVLRNIEIRPIIEKGMAGRARGYPQT